ncbi:MAG: MBL fold metallo-hydrolase [Candidatus Thorarchaeota archaeon]|nr:MBL fold metallo-hydrolase [Candidatus Thorarchaeota archaeon]
MLKITYFGHTTFLLEAGENTVLLNPGIWDGTPVVPDDINVRLIIATHHLDDALGNATAIAEQSKAWILGNEITIEKVKSQGGKPWLLHVLKSDTPYEIPGFKVTAHPLKRAIPDTGEKIENLGLYIEMGKMRVAYLGDAMVRGPFGQFETDILIAPVSGEGVFPVKDAVSLCIDAKPKVGIAMRWTSEEQTAKFSKYVDQFARECTPVVMKPNQTLSAEWSAGYEFRFTLS